MNNIELQKEAELFSKLLHHDPEPYDGTLYSIYQKVSEILDEPIENNSRKHDKVFLRQLSQAVAWYMNESRNSHFTHEEITSQIGGKKRPSIFNSISKIQRYMEQGYRYDDINNVFVYFSVDERYFIGNREWKKHYILLKQEGRVVRKFQTWSEMEKEYGMKASDIQGYMYKGHRLLGKYNISLS